MTVSPKKVSPATVNLNDWRWGFTPQAESWNGRFAMLGFVAALLTEYLSGQGVLHFYNLVETVTTVIMLVGTVLLKSVTGSDAPELNVALRSASY
jgi:Chlorophyll A-B binding protein